MSKEVMALPVDAEGAAIHVGDYRHHRKPSVEELLEEFDLASADAADAESRALLIAEYAGKLREAVRGE